MRLCETRGAPTHAPSGSPSLARRMIRRSFPHSPAWMWLPHTTCSPPQLLRGGGRAGAWIQTCLGDPELFLPRQRHPKLCRRNCGAAR
jgi:hypothetical protein